MSSGRRISLAQAQALGNQLAGLLGQVCTRIEVAGSVRRLRPDVGDIELVALPRLRQQGQVGLFGGSRQINELWELVDRLVAEPDGVLRRAPSKTLTCPKCRGAGAYGDTPCERCGTLGEVERAAPYGERHRQLLTRGGVQVDLFTASAETWGAQLLIRTGPARLSQAWVTELLGCGLRMAGGCVRNAVDQVVAVRDETDAFDLVGWPWVAPEYRSEAEYDGRWPS